MNKKVKPKGCRQWSVTMMALALSATTQAANFSLSSATEMQCKAVEHKVVTWRREIHQHPELGNREFKTAAKVAAHLKSLGITVQTGVAHTGVVGILEGKKAGPVVAIRADMDGLPISERNDLPFRSQAMAEYNGEKVGVMHACGHDTHVAILMGVAEVLAARKNEVAGTVKFIFQPAEEGVPKGERGGAELMVEEGVLNNPKVDRIFALHIDASLDAGKIGWKSGSIAAAVDDFRIVIKGKGSHGAYPWAGIDPIVTSAQVINSLQTVVSRSVDLLEEPAVVTVGKINGGVRSNIIPEQVEMLGTVRTLNDNARTLVHARIRSIVEHVASSMGATAEVNLPYSSHYPVNKNDANLVQQMLPVLQSVAGPHNVLEIKAQTGAEDHAFFAKQVPSFYFNLGGKIPSKDIKDVADHHTPGFHIDESGFALGVRALTAMTLAALQTPTP